MAAGIYRPVDDALRIAFTELVAWIHADYGLSEIDAYELLSKVGKVHLTEMVDPNYVVIASVEKKISPAEEIAEEHFPFSVLPPPSNGLIVYSVLPGLAARYAHLDTQVTDWLQCGYGSERQVVRAAGHGSIGDILFVLARVFFLAIVLRLAVLAWRIHHFSTYMPTATHSFPVHDRMGQIVYLNPNFGKFYVSLPWLWCARLRRPLRPAC